MNASKSPPPGGGVVMVAVEIPAHYAERIQKSQLVPRELVFEQVGEFGLTAGQPVMLPVRAVLPMDVVVMMQRAIQGGQVVPAVLFQVPDATERKPASPLVLDT